MATLINVYKDATYLDAYSKDGAQDDPVYKYPPISFDGDTGQVRDVQLFGKNDGTTDIKDLTITPTDTDGADETGWMKLATSQAGLGTAIAGAALAIGNVLVGETFTFWERMTVPADQSPENKLDLTLRITGQGYPTGIL